MNIKNSIDEYTRNLKGILANDIEFEVTWKSTLIDHSDKYNLGKNIQNEIKDKSGVYVYSLNEIPLYIGEGILSDRIYLHWNEAQFLQKDYTELFGEKEELLNKKIIDNRNRVLHEIGCSINQVRFFSYKKFFKPLDLHYLSIENTFLKKNISKCLEIFLTLQLNPVYERIKSKTGGIWVSHSIYDNAIEEALLESTKTK